MDARIDTFLQLESAYDGEDLIASAASLASDGGAAEPSSFLSGHLSSAGLVSRLAAGGGASGEDAAAQVERARFLAHARGVEERMQAAEAEVAQRILSMRRILELRDPMEQLAEYVALSLEPRREADTDVVGELLESAKRLPSGEDREAALLAAFFFMCDPPRPKPRGMAPLLPIVAAMTEAASGMDHAPF